MYPLAALPKASRADNVAVKGDPAVGVVVENADQVNELSVAGFTVTDNPPPLLMVPSLTTMGLVVAL